MRSRRHDLRLRYAHEPGRRVARNPDAERTGSGAQINFIPAASNSAIACGPAFAPDGCHTLGAARVATENLIQLVATTIASSTSA